MEQPALFFGVNVLTQALSQPGHMVTAKFAALHAKPPVRPSGAAPWQSRGCANRQHHCWRG